MAQHPSPRPGSLMDTIVDLLEIDGGTWTTTQIADRLKRDRALISRYVTRALDHGWIAKVGETNTGYGKPMSDVYRFAGEPWWVLERHEETACWTPDVAV